jgi:hypothetical protein
VKNVALFIFLILGGFASIAFSVWTQATKLPDWYNENQTDSRSVEDIKKSALSIEQKIQQNTMEPKPQTQAPVVVESPTAVESPKQSSIPSPAQSPAQSPTQSSAPNPKVVVQNTDRKPPQVEPQKKALTYSKIALNSQELNDLIVTRIAEKHPSKTLPSSVKQFHTAVQEDTLKTGAVVDVNELKAAGFGPQGQQFLTQLAETLPEGNRKIYVGVEGKPEVKNGQLQFGPNTRIRLGNLSFSMAELSDRLGISQEQLKEKLALGLQLQNLNISGIDFQNGNAILQTSPKPSP